MTVRSLGTQEMGEGFECLEEQNCDPPPHTHTTRSTIPIGSQSQRDKGNREEVPQRVREEGCLLRASA